MDLVLCKTLHPLPFNTFSKCQMQPCACRHKLLVVMTSLIS